MAKAYLEITLKINEADRANAAGVYSKYKSPFLETIKGALSKELLVHTEDIQVLHSFDSTQSAQEYLLSDLFNQDVVEALKPYLKGQPDIKIYNVA
ncbi:MAG: hypothetical protein QM594_11845 [Niabella sp.]